ncbi:MAG: 3-dehydroquinate synthase [Clostridia bacterium]|nr:3-dehydroquinate synthase [Clostridia bacterium]
MKTRVELGENSYDIIIERGAIKNFSSLTGIKGKVLVVTDDGVPQEYSQKIASQFEDAFIYTVPQGEGSKSLDCFGKILSFMLSKNFTRKDSVVACGGGVVGDLSGFVSACYMRGINFYNFPTTVLSQVDSSVGGKTAVNLDGIKNPIGAFHQPKMVVIDPDVLSTLPPRQISNGLAEAVKMSLTSDAELFKVFEEKNILENIDDILFRSVEIKRKVVEQDEKEAGLRMILNFGHTLGHGIESEEELNGLYHGECIAMGMLPMCSEPVRARLIAVLQKLNLKTSTSFDVDTAMNAVMHDKKSGAGAINTIVVEEVGTCEIKKMTAEELKQKLMIIREG